jgi:methylthioribose-1-phosphate isomerase
MRETSETAAPFSPIRWEDGHLKLLDQTRLPDAEAWLDCESPYEVADAIRRLAVRGAPAIGVAAAYGLVLGIRTVRGQEGLAARFAEVSELLGRTRPTAVNLRWALERGREVFERSAAGGQRGRSSPGPTPCTPKTCGSTRRLASTAPPCSGRGRGC